MISVLGLTCSDGKLEYDEPLERHRTVYTVGKAVKAAIIRAKAARTEAECWPSDWLKVLEVLSGERQRRTGFTLSDGFLDWLYLQMIHIERLDWHGVTVEDLETILLHLDADE